jgi:hypothetical protein
MIFEKIFTEECIEFHLNKLAPILIMMDNLEGPPAEGTPEFDELVDKLFNSFTGFIQAALNCSGLLKEINTIDLIEKEANKIKEVYAEMINTCRKEFEGFIVDAIKPTAQA